MNSLTKIIFGVLFFFVLQPVFGQGLTPQSPSVVQAIERAKMFLQTEGARENRLGGKALIAMALYKAGIEKNHPMIRNTIDEIRKSVASDGTVTISDHIYTAGLVVMFLGELEPDLYRRELDAYLRFLHKNQRSDGAWTYLTSGTADNYPSGDMSMTQYAVMALWTLHQHGFPVSGESANRVGNWLCAVQNPEGAFAYQTSVSADLRPTSWNGVRLSMSAAGMASVYVCRDLFGINGEPADSKEDAVHEAFKEISEDGVAFAGIGDFQFSVPKAIFNSVQMKGNAWLERNFQPITLSTEYFFYYLYALERYAAFRELAENKHHESPPWYDKTAAFLLKNQGEDGSWRGNIGPGIDTAYAVLFLLRSTRRTFEKLQPAIRFAGGSLIGGRGLPRITDEIAVEDGRIISHAEITDPTQLLERLESMEDADEELLEKLAELPAQEVENLLHRNKSKIKKLVGDEKAEKRFGAVTLLGKSGDVSNAPALIYALTDPDPDVAQAAQNALLRLARIPRNEEIPKDNSSESRRKRERNIERWKNWYRNFDPDAVFEER